MESIVDVVKFLTGAAQYEPIVIDTRREFYERQYNSTSISPTCAVEKA